MIPAKNYETVSTFGQVMQRKLLASIFPGHGVDHITLVMCLGYQWKTKVRTKEAWAYECTIHQELTALLHTCASGASFSLTRWQHSTATFQESWSRTLWFPLTFWEISRAYYTYVYSSQRQTIKYFSLTFTAIWLSIQLRQWKVGAVKSMLMKACMSYI